MQVEVEKIYAALEGLLSGVAPVMEAPDSYRQGVRDAREAVEAVVAEEKAGENPEQTR